MESSKKVKITFDGTTDVKNFLTKVELEASLKDYVDEKKANFLASRLVGPAFDVYMRLTDANRKDFDQIKDELKKEFERGQLNREEALSILQSRIRGPKESAQTFAYKLSELVQLAYPTFSDPVRKTIAKDYYVKGVHPDMQVALKSRATFNDDDISTLATETVRLSLAGVKTYSKSTTTSEACGSVEVAPMPMQLEGAPTNVINAIADVVVSKLKESSLDSSESSAGRTAQQSDGINNAGVTYSRGRAFSGRRGARGRGGRGNNNQSKKCRSCQSTEHLIKHCPTRFCQACGQRGHDQYDQQCPNYS